MDNFCEYQMMADGSSNYMYATAFGKFFRKVAGSKVATIMTGGVSKLGSKDGRQQLSKSKVVTVATGGINKFGKSKPASSSSTVATPIPSSINTDSSLQNPSLEGLVFDEQTSKMPTWGWVAIGVGGFAVLGSVVYLIVKK